MTATSEDIQRLLVAHFRDDEEAFRAAAWDVVNRERRLNHTVFADELDRILEGANGTRHTTKAFFATLTANRQERQSD